MRRAPGEKNPHARVSFRADPGRVCTPRPLFAAHKCRRRWQSPASRKICLASGGCNYDQTRPRLGLVCLSKTPSVFLGRAHPGSEMAGKNGSHKDESDILRGGVALGSYGDAAAREFGVIDDARGWGRYTGRIY